MTAFGHLSIGDRWDSDDELTIDGAYFGRSVIRGIRDHLSQLLGDAPTPYQPRSLAMPSTEALKLAEETVGRLAPATNARGYTDGTAPLRERADVILRLADFLMKGGF